MTDPVVAQKSPYVMTVKPGTYAWCRCGRAKSQPYCDGSHKGTGIAPLVVTIEQEKHVAWCGCKHSGTPPYCDGSHKTLS